MRKLSFAHWLAIIITVVIIMLAVVTKIKSIDTPRVSERIYSQYSVKQGDTLWDIASELNEFPDLSTADYVGELRKLNSIYVDKLNVGQVITYFKPIK